MRFFHLPTTLALLSFTATRGEHGAHDDGPPEKDVDPSNTYDPYPATPITHCRPEHDGFFGSGNAGKYEVRYRYGVETIPDLTQNDKEEVYWAVQRTVEAILLYTYFPSICKSGDLPMTGIVGMHFSTQPDPTVGNCDPLINPAASCQLFEGVLDVYGEELNVVSTINTHLGHDNPRNIDPRILRLFTVALSESGVPDEGDKSSQGSDGLTGGAKAGITISLLLLVTGIVGLVLFEYKKRKAYEKGTPLKDSTGSIQEDTDGELSPLEYDFVDHKEENEDDLNEESDLNESDLDCSDLEDLEIIDLEDGSTMYVDYRGDQSLGISPRPASSMAASSMAESYEY